MEVVQEVRVHGLKEALRALSAEALSRSEGLLVESLAKLSASRASSYSPKRTGKLAASISVRRLSGMRFSVTPGVSYWPYLEFGVRPFELNSRVYIQDVGFRHVHVHPGIRPHRFLRRAASESLRELGKLARSLLRERVV
ncbi:MAG: HK97 gp10 family phage protein [Thaumarchaeota archaeon]|nr:HK97 gp10 family phage protein [Candidatus Calditenuaceae archaeon]MDW8042306.1 HK97 gp10 family phage protein [Nitrososphaerota archaeon]